MNLWMLVHTNDSWKGQPCLGFTVNGEKLPDGLMAVYRSEEKPSSDNIRCRQGEANEWQLIGECGTQAGTMKPAILNYVADFSGQSPGASTRPRIGSIVETTEIMPLAALVHRLGLAERGELIGITADNGEFRLRFTKESFQAPAAAERAAQLEG